jgi:hypothetical protein
MINSFVYCWTDLENNKLYIGSHKGDENDGYICSSKLMLKEYKKRPKTFIREIIAKGDYKTIRNFESVLLITLNAAIDDNFYNLHNSDGKFYCSGHSDESKKKMSKSQKGRKHSEETKSRMSDSMKNKKHKSYYGRPMKEETKQKIIDSNKGRKASEETKNKMREARRRYLELKNKEQ